MPERKPHYDLTAYALGEGVAGLRAEIEGHLKTCPVCRARLEEIESTARLMRGAKLHEAPEDVWRRVSSEIENGKTRPSRRLRCVPALAVAATVAALFLIGPRGASGLDVAIVSGTPSLAGNPIRPGQRLAIGAVMETDARSSARVLMPKVGYVDLLPGSTMRLEESNAKSQMFTLSRGRLKARVDAPPRLFVVQTPSARAVDLGCAYELIVDAKGTLLRVDQGWVMLERSPNEAYVPAGMSCRTDPTGAVGTPFRTEGGTALRNAVDAFDAGVRVALQTILKEAQPEDALTLWHLLRRAVAAERRAVYLGLVNVAPLPGGVSEADVLRLDPEALRLWREDFAPISDYDFWKNIDGRKKTAVASEPGMEI